MSSGPGRKGRAALLTPLAALLLVGTLVQPASGEDTPPGTDVALASAGAVATSSGNEVPTALGPELAIDGIWDSDASRWSGEAADDGWFQVRLTKRYRLDHVAIQWSTSCPKRYQLQVSNDGVTWVDATAPRTPPACRAWDVVNLGLDQPYQYVRMQGIQRSLSYGYSINEFEVLDGPAPPAPQVTTGTTTDLSSTSATLHGVVVPKGDDTSYQFEWGPVGSGPWGTAKVPPTPIDVGADPTAHNVRQTISGLKPGTTYMYRLVARVGAEPAAGTEQTFTTLAPPPVPVENDVTPAPATMVQNDNAPPFVLGPDTRIVTQGRAATAVARPLAQQLHRATGYQIRMTAGASRRGDITIVVDPRRTIDGFAGNTQAYTLTASDTGVLISAPSPAGAFYGVQTLRQLFPAYVESCSPVHAEWSVPNVHITDGPRYGYRGVMLDLARNFLSATEVERFINQMSYLKMNELHLHLSDDQGWRIQITNAGRARGDDIDYGKLTERSGSTAIDEGGTDNLPGQTGFLTQYQYRQIVAYAAERYITVIPEIDLPGHSSAILHAIPQLNTAHSVPQPPPGHSTIPANTTQQVGESSLDTRAEVTYTFLAHVFGQLAKMTPGHYIGVGGDEALSTKPDDYNYFTDRVIRLVHGLGKETTGWNLSYAAAGATALGSRDLIQYYNGSDTTTAADAANNGTGVVVSYYPYTYLDYPYSAGDFDQYYDWDVPDTVPDVPPSSIKGIEAPLWTETLRSDAEAEYQTWPRAAATAEVGWSPKSAQDERQFAARLAMLGDRWTLQTTNFYASPLTRWAVAAAGTDQTVRSGNALLGLGTALAPGTSLSDVNVTVDWGDGTTPTPAHVALSRTSDNTHVNGAYRLSGSHRYRRPGRYTAHLHVATPTGSAEARFTIRVESEGTRPG